MKDVTTVLKSPRWRAPGRAEGRRGILGYLGKMEKERV